MSSPNSSLNIFAASVFDTYRTSRTPFSISTCPFTSVTCSLETCSFRKASISTFSRSDLTKSFTFKNKMAKKLSSSNDTQIVKTAANIDSLARLKPEKPSLMTYPSCIVSSLPLSRMSGVVERQVTAQHAYKCTNFF